MVLHQLFGSKNPFETLEFTFDYDDLDDEDDAANKYREKVIIFEKEYK